MHNPRIAAEIARIVAKPNLDHDWAEVCECGHQAAVAIKDAEDAVCSAKLLRMLEGFAEFVQAS